MRLFFYPFFDPSALAKKNVSSQEMKLEIANPFVKIDQKSIIVKGENSKSCQANSSSSQFEKGINPNQSLYEDLTKGHPIETMASEIAKKDKIVAAFLVGIAKKESDWGKHSPKKNGKDCFNYWGYKGNYNLTDSGYSCFDSPDQAVKVVGGRIEELISQRINTPERMVVWKCGRTCAGHDPAGVKKWISDVSSYFYLSADEAGKLNS